MQKFEITLSYSKIIEAVDEADAQAAIDRIENDSPLDDEYGPFSSLDSWTSVKKVHED